VDQGYFLCVKSEFIETSPLAAPYTNRRGQEIMKEHSLTFTELLSQLSEAEDPNRSLKTIVEQVLKNDEEKRLQTKFLFRLTQRKQINIKLSTQDSTKFDKTKALPFTNYRGKIFRMSKTEAIIILSEQRLAKNLLMAENMKKTIVCTLSHDLKTLLNGVIGNLDLLEGVRLEGECKRSQKVAACSSRLLDYKIKDLFDYIQLQNKEFKLHCEEFELEGILEEIKTVTKWVAKQKNLKIEANLESSHGKTMIGDKNRIIQILLNLISKAIELSELGSTIQLLLKRTKENRIKFKVKSFGTFTNAKINGNTKNTPSSRRARSMTICGNEQEQVTENLEALSLEIAQLICKEMDTNIMAKTVNGVYAELKFSVRDGFAPKRIDDLFAANDKVRRLSVHESKKSKEQKEAEKMAATQRRVENDLMSKSFYQTENSSIHNVIPEKLMSPNKLEKINEAEFCSPERDIPCEFIQKECISLPISPRKLILQGKQSSTTINIPSPIHCLPTLNQTISSSPVHTGRRKNASISLTGQETIVFLNNRTQLTEVSGKEKLKVARSNEYFAKK
jgi:nitrogen-specific signal transduction histidine kinase